MKIDFIIISGILVIISFLPFILLPILGLKDRKSLYSRFRKTASEAGLNISFKLQWNSNIAGIDILKQQFLFVQKPEKDFIIHQINLSQVNKITMVSKNCEYKLKGKIMETLSRVDLEFHYHNCTEPVSINLFDYNLNYTEDLEIKNSQKLLFELEKYINAKPILKHTA